MTHLEALVSISQTLLRVNGRWCVDGIDATLRRDIQSTVYDVERLLRPDFGYDREKLMFDAIEELERRAIPAVVD